jgi:hypothetical protein
MQGFPFRYPGCYFSCTPIPEGLPMRSKGPDGPPPKNPSIPFFEGPMLLKSANRLFVRFSNSPLGGPLGYIVKR